MTIYSAILTKGGKRAAEGLEEHFVLIVRETAVKKRKHVSL